MKQFYRMMLLSVMVSLLSGCGGGGSHSATGRAILTVIWPAPSRLIPLASNSIKVEIKNGTGVVDSKLLARPTGGGSATATFDPLPVGDLIAQATAYPNADGTGTAQASASVPLKIEAGKSTGFSIMMASTIDHLEVSPANPMLTAGQSVTLTATAKDAAGNVVLTSASKRTWSSSSAAIATVDTNGKVTAVATGTATITVTDTESGKNASIPLVVTASGQLIVYEGFNYAPDSLLVNQSGGIGWSNAWNEYGQGYTSSVMDTGSLTFGNLVTSGNSMRTTSDRPIGHVRALNTTLGASGTTVYFSILLRPLDPMDAGWPNTYFGFGFGTLHIGKSGDSPFYVIEHAGGGRLVASSVRAEQNQTVFLVVRATFKDGADTIDLFVNPTPGQPLPTVPDATKNDEDMGVVSAIGLGTSIRCVYDELRVGTTYADVMPIR